MLNREGTKNTKIHEEDLKREEAKRRRRIRLLVQRAARPSVFSQQNLNFASSQLRV
jgi:hypothetical protein